MTSVHHFQSPADLPPLTSTLLDAAAALERQFDAYEARIQSLNLELHTARQREQRMLFAIRQLRRMHRTQSHAKTTKLFKTWLAELTPQLPSITF